MKTELKTIYKCEFCNKLYQRKDFAIKHEKMCKDNPENKRACLDGCIHLHKKVTTIYYDSPIGETSRKVSLFYCKAKQLFLYPPEVEVKGNDFELGSQDNQPMPKQCDSFNNPMEAYFNEPLMNE